MKSRLIISAVASCLLLFCFADSHSEQLDASAAERAKKILRELDDLWIGTSSHSILTMRVKTANYSRDMTLEGWSMGIVRPVMSQHPWAWAFFIPFIIIATFTILNLFIGIIVSTMQELSQLPDPASQHRDVIKTLEQLDANLKELRSQLSTPPSGNTLS